MPARPPFPYKRSHVLLFASASAALLAGCLEDVRYEDPVVRVASPAPTAVDTDALEISGKASDTDGLVRIAYQLNGGAEQPVVVPTGSEAEFAFTVELVDGDNVIVINAYDRKGRVGTSTVRVKRNPDTLAPTLALAAPADGSTVTQPRVRVQGTASDDRSVRRITWQQSGGAEQTALVNRSRAASFDFEITGLAGGANALAIHAYDSPPPRRRPHRPHRRRRRPT